MIDNFTKPTNIAPPLKLGSFSRIAQQHRQESKVTAVYRKEKNITHTILNTEYKETSSKNKTDRRRHF